MQLKRMQSSLKVRANSETFTMFLTTISVYADKSLFSPTVNYYYTFLSCSQVCAHEWKNVLWQLNNTYLWPCKNTSFWHFQCMISQNLPGFGNVKRKLRAASIKPGHFRLDFVSKTCDGTRWIPLCGLPISTPTEAESLRGNTNW